MTIPEKRSPEAKNAYIEACLSDEVEYTKSAGFDAFDFVNQAASEISLSEIDVSLTFLGKTLKAPLMIAPMTGGIAQGHHLNRIWARAAEHFGLAMSVGSQRVGIEDEDRAQYYRVREDAKSILLFGNIGAGQLCRGFGVDEARRAVEMIEADALFIHLNAIQEACQGGDVNFHGLLGRISIICEALSRDGIPVFAREVGFGLSAQAARRLVDAGIQGLDCGGAGGTSWAKVEAKCDKSPRRRKMGQLFGEWGIPTAQSILQVRSVAPQIPLIATGGLRSGSDLAKALMLGADIGAMARPFLVAACDGEERLHELITDLLDELKICMFGVGARDLQELKSKAQTLSFRAH